MTLKPDEFIRRFLIHVLPNGFHRIRHYGLLASGTKTATIARARELIAAATPVQTAHKPQAPESAAATDKPTQACRCCGGRMSIFETFKRGSTPRYRPPRQPRSGSIRHDRYPHATATFTQICVCDLHLGIDPRGPRQDSRTYRQANHARQRRRPMRSMASIAITHRTCHAQISIAPAARPPATSRGFLPWRLSDARPGFGGRSPVRHRPTSETLHSSGQTSPFAAAAIAGDGFRYEPDRDRLGQISGKIIDATARFHRGAGCCGGANGLVECGAGGAAEADAGDRLSQHDYA